MKNADSWSRSDVCTVKECVVSALIVIVFVMFAKLWMLAKALFWEHFTHRGPSWSGRPAVEAAGVAMVWL